jgi:hypothetical protein
MTRLKDLRAFDRIFRRANRTSKVADTDKRSKTVFGGIVFGETVFGGIVFGETVFVFGGTVFRIGGIMDDPYVAFFYVFFPIFFCFFSLAFFLATHFATYKKENKTQGPGEPTLRGKRP